MFYHFLHKYISWNGHPVAVFCFNNHKEQTYIACSSFNLIIFIKNANCVIQFDGVAEKYDNPRSNIG